MGYQEVFIKSANNRSTRILLKAMIRENIRSENDMFASINCIAIPKKNLITTGGESIKAGTELIVITGDRLRSTKEYLSTDGNKMPYKLNELLVIQKTQSIPIESTQIKDIKEYKSNIKEISIKDFLRNIEKVKESR